MCLYVCGVLYCIYIKDFWKEIKETLRRESGWRENRNEKELYLHYLNTLLFLI